jgi:hypothetical protein
MGGLLQAPIEAWEELIKLCMIICICDKTPEPSVSGKSLLKQSCVKNALRAAHKAGEMENMRPEIPYNMTPKPPNPPTPLLHRVDDGMSLDPSTRLSTRMEQEGLKAAKDNGWKYDVRIPDVVISRAINSDPALAASSLTAPNLKAVVEIKFNNQTRDAYQIRDYRRIAGGSRNRVVELNPTKCMCQVPDEERERVLREKLEEERERRRLREAERRSIRLPLPSPEAATWTALGAALYWLVSEGSRVVPWRNLIPIL